jgi:hypothetical protein
MKKLSMFLILVLIFTTSLVFAEDSAPVVDNGGVEATTEVTTEATTEATTVTTTEATTETTTEVPKNKGNVQQKKDAMAEWKLVKDEVKAAKAEGLVSKETLKADLKEALNQRKIDAKELYTPEELATFEDSLASITSDSAISKVLSIGSISVKKNLIKFDTPPYIKGGRTVVPVKAITQGLGATVTFNAETFEVTIVKDDITIVLTIGSNVALVNGKPVELDAKSEITNSRTYVPIKFIAETFGLSVEWDADTETIDIEDGTEVEATTEVTTEVTTEATTEPVTKAGTQQ